MSAYSKFSSNHFVCGHHQQHISLPYQLLPEHSTALWSCFAGPTTRTPPGRVPLPYPPPFCHLSHCSCIILGCVCSVFVPKTVEDIAVEMNDADVKSEQEVWASLEVSAWSNAISDSSSTFAELYHYTTDLIEEELRLNKHDIIMEIGCGTGEVISSINTDLPRVGVDINETFVSYCQSRYPEVSFHVVDATELVSWWMKSPYKGYTSPLLLCCNNTMNIIPLSIRFRVMQEMRYLCDSGKEQGGGRVLVSYWNGWYFSHGVRDFYMKNPSLCGPVDINKDVNWKTNTMLTASGYHTQWLTPEMVMRLMKCYDLDPQYSTSLINDDCLIAHGLGIFVLFTGRTSGARSLYDSEDAQIFYSQVWGQGTGHLGRYDDNMKLSSDPLVLSTQVVNAQHLHEQDFCDAVCEKIEHCEGRPIPCRFLDMGCGYGMLPEIGLKQLIRRVRYCLHNYIFSVSNMYTTHHITDDVIGGLLRKFKDHEFLRNGVGIDFSARMCQRCVMNNQLAGMDGCIEVRNESFLDTSLDDEVIDVCVSMEAFLHVGLDGQRKALKEVYRVLRPGGWLLFSDVMECEGIAREEIAPLYERLHISQLGTVAHYRKIAEELGFRSFTFVSHAKNVRKHYEALYRMVRAFRMHPDPARRLDVSETFYEDTVVNMRHWADLAEGRIEWGIFTMRKV